MAPQRRRSQVVVATAAAAASAAPGLTSGPGPNLTSGYESPSEDNQPSFFAVSSGNATPGPPVPTPASTTLHRPAFSSRPSYIISVPPSTNHTTPSPENLHGLDTVLSALEKLSPDRKVGLRDRIACFQWTFFTMTMATGGIANVLHSRKYTSLNQDNTSSYLPVPYSAKWITGIGLFFFILNLVLFIINCVCITLRFHFRPGTFINSFTDQVESLFIPSFFVSIAIIMINICEYGVPHVGRWLLHTMEVMFWFYVALSAISSAGLYLILWSTLVFPVHMMTPTWVFPAYPLLLTAPFAANLIASAEKSPHNLMLHPSALALCAVTIQGTGILIAFMISAAFIYRLMTQKLPRDNQRPGVFISIGPFGFTAAGIAQLGSQAETILPPNFLGTPLSVDIVKVVSVLVALWLWGLCMWFFLVSVGSLWKYARAGSSIPFQMTWWSFVFPNTALVTATGVMGNVLKSRGLNICTCVMAVALIIVWVSIFITMLNCLKQKKLLWPKGRV